MANYPTAKDIKGQKQPYPAKQSEMDPLPKTDFDNYLPAGKLKGKVAIITGADSGIGLAVAIGFCLEGANVAIVYNENDADANETQRLCEAKGTKCLVIRMDVRSAENCKANTQRL